MKMMALSRESIIYHPLSCAKTIFTLNEDKGAIILLLYFLPVVM
jgi:hypothetical protein